MAKQGGGAEVAKFQEHQEVGQNVSESFENVKGMIY